MNDDKKTCADLIKSEMEDRELYFKELYDKWDDENDDEALSEIYETALSIDEITIIKILLSTGGPSDWLSAHYINDEFVEPFKVMYHYSDWFDGAEEVVQPDSYLWRYATETVESMKY